MPSAGHEQTERHVGIMVDGRAWGRENPGFLLLRRRLLRSLRCPWPAPRHQPRTRLSRPAARVPPCWRFSAAAFSSWSSSRCSRALPRRRSPTRTAIRYESTAKLLFNQTLGADIRALGLLPDSPDADNLAQNNVQIIGSRRVAEATARELAAAGSTSRPKRSRTTSPSSTEQDTDVVGHRGQVHSADRAALLASVYAAQGQAIAQGDLQEQARRIAGKPQCAARSAARRAERFDGRGLAAAAPASRTCARCRRRARQPDDHPARLRPHSRRRQPGSARCSSGALRRRSRRRASRCCASRPTAACIGQRRSPRPSTLRFSPPSRAAGH